MRVNFWLKSLLGVTGVVCILLPVDSAEAVYTPAPHFAAPPKSTKKRKPPQNEEDPGGTSRLENEFLAACEAGNTAKVKSLLDQGVSVRTTDSGGYSGLHLALRHVPVIRLLVENKANINSVDSRGRTPLILAAISGYVGSVEELLHASAKVDVRDADGCTALARAVLNRRPRTVALLIANGANVHIQDNKGRTPREMAKETKENTQILQMLEQAVVNPTRAVPGNVNTTPPEVKVTPHLPTNPTPSTGALRYANDMLAGVAQETARSRTAQHYFDGKPEAQLRRELEALRRDQTRGSFGYRSLSYVLAYYGVDVIINAQRVMYNWLYPDVFGDEPKSKLPDTTAEAIKRLYQRNPSDELLGKVFYVVRQNRVNSEDPSILVSDMFVQYPTALLRTAVVRSTDNREASVSALRGY